MSLISLHGEGHDIAVAGLDQGEVQELIEAGQAHYLDVRPAAHMVVEAVAPDCLEFRSDWGPIGDQSEAPDAYQSDTTL